MSNKNAPKKKEGGGSEPAFEAEQLFLLRLPPGPAMALRHDVQSGSMTLKDKLTIDLQNDMRHARVRYGGDIFQGKIVDLPTIVESLKTVDQKTFYKTADICQMLVCSMEDDYPSQEENESPKKKDRDKKYAWNHGITPPLKNVKKRRFRKTLKKRYMDQPDTEKEVKRLFRYDAEAIDVKWEVITEEEKNPSQESGSQSQQVVEASGTITKGDLKRSDTSISLDIASYFGEVSSSEEDEDKDINIMDSGDDEMSRGPSTPRVMGYGGLERVASENQDLLGDSDTAELQNKLMELTRQLEEIRENRNNQEQQTATVENPALRERMQAELDRLVQEESEKEREYEILSSMLNQG